MRIPDNVEKALVSAPFLIFNICRRALMKRCLIYFALVLVVALPFGWVASPALAHKEFKAEWDATYVQPGSSDPAVKALAAAAKEAKCFVCHVGSSRKVRNAYGMELAKLLTKADKTNKDKIHAAFETVAALKCDPKNDSSPTYGDRIKEGKLPVPVVKKGAAASK